MIIFQCSNHLFISNRRRIAKPLEWIDRITFSKVFPSSWQRCHTWLRRQSKGRQPWHWNKEISETWLETRVYSCFKVKQRIVHQFWRFSLHSIASVFYTTAWFPTSGSLSRSHCRFIERPWLSSGTELEHPCPTYSYLFDFVGTLMFILFLKACRFVVVGHQRLGLRVAPQCLPQLLCCQITSPSLPSKWWVLHPKHVARGFHSNTWKMTKLEISFEE